MEPKIYQAIDIAIYIVKKYIGEDYKIFVSGDKLHDILFYCQLFNYKYHNRQLFEDEIFMTPYGPRIPSLDYNFGTSPETMFMVPVAYRPERKIMYRKRNPKKHLYDFRIEMDHGLWPHFPPFEEVIPNTDTIIVIDEVIRHTKNMSHHEFLKILYIKSDMYIEISNRNEERTKYRGTYYPIANNDDFVKEVKRWNME